MICVPSLKIMIRHFFLSFFLSFFQMSELYLKRFTTRLLATYF